MDNKNTSFNILGRYPVGDSDFPKIRKKCQVYVDKTALLYRLAHDTDYYFLSRPRRFGKSLMLSTLEAYFQGRKELFEGLAIADLETEWRVHPVIHITMGGKDYRSINALESHLRNVLDDNERRLGVDAGLQNEDSEGRFYNLIRKAQIKYGENVVILIDEYGKPMLDTRHRDEDLHSDDKNLLRGFYGVIKESAAYIRFVMITGVTKFSHVNIFSGLNNLRDISLEPEYNAICGISECEMKEYFSEDMKVFANKNGLTLDEASKKFKLHYDGYMFASEGENIYNPYSTIMAFSKMTFGNYWFTSGTSNYLVEDLKRRNYDFSTLEDIHADADELMQEPVLSDDPTALLYQSGYLTIKNYQSGIYYLGFPNKEVQSGFYKELLHLLVPVQKSKFSAANLALYAEKGDVEAMMNMLQLGLSQFNNMEMKKIELEYHLKVILKALLMAAGLKLTGEVQTPVGRIDMVLENKEYIYLFEFKINSTAKKALAQIDEKDYPFHYYSDSRKIVKIGTSYSTRYRRLTSWLVAEGTEVLES